jgi:Protein of unknown function DUF2625
MRAIEELTDVRRPAWPLLAKALRRSRVPVETVPVDPEGGRSCIYRLQVTAGSPLGALALNTGGLLVDDGWVRVLGGGSPAAGLPDLATANGLDGQVTASPPAMLVGYDVLGGRFEVNGADPAALARPGAPGELCYFGQDTLEWVALGAGHGDWLTWLMDGGTRAFYRHLRWPGWEAEARSLRGDHAIAVYPFLCTREALADLAGTSRTVVPVDEVFRLNETLVAQLRGNA